MAPTPSDKSTVHCTTPAARHVGPSYAKHGGGREAVPPPAPRGIRAWVCGSVQCAVPCARAAAGAAPGTAARVSRPGFWACVCVVAHRSVASCEKSRNRAGV